MKYPSEGGYALSPIMYSLIRNTKDEAYALEMDEYEWC